MPHIKNPLSVVAIFAGFAEVSGTAILPFLDKGIQSVYVWFLMGFPALLVGLFFAILNWNHTALYAPSDFKDERHFTSLTKASRLAVESKAREEITENAFEEPPQTQPIGASINELAANRPSEALPKQSLKLTPEERMDRVKRAEDMAFWKLETDRHILFVRNVTPARWPGLVFDGVSADPDHTTVVEVKYTIRPAAYPSQTIQQVLDRVLKLQNDLKDLPKHKAVLDFIFVFVTEDDASDLDVRKLTERTEKLASNYPFKVEVLIYRYGELMGIFG